MRVKRLFSCLIVLSVIMFNCSPVFAKSIEKEIAELKSKNSALEQKLSQQEEKIGKQAEFAESLEEIKDAFDGLLIGAGATFVMQGTHNANNTLGKNGDVIDASYSFDLEVEKKLQNYGRAYTHLEAGGGSGVEDELTVFSNVNGDADNDQNLRLTEIWYEHYLKNLPLTLTFGKLDPTVYLDTNIYANDETTQYLGRLFRNSPTIEFPNNSFGLRLSIVPNEIFDVELGIFDADADFEDAFDSLFFGSQITFKPILFNREGNYRILGWLNDRNHTEWLDSTKDKKEGYGFDLSFDQELTDNLGSFVRYSWQNLKIYLMGSSLEQSWSTGLQVKGSLWGKENDILGLAIGQVIPSDNYRKADAMRNARKEGHLEVYYNIHINEHLHLSLDIQAIWNPYGDDVADRKDTITIFGLRTQLDF